MSDWKYIAIVGPSWELSKDFYKQHVSPLLVQPYTGAHTQTITQACMHLQATHMQTTNNNIWGTQYDWHWRVVPPVVS